MTDLTTADVARRLGVTIRRALGLVLEKKIAGRQLSSGVWLIDAASVARYERMASHGSGRTLSQATSWAVLWELSGLEVTWLGESTHARVKRRIRDSSAEDIARLVATRTTEHRYTAANPERVQAKLMATGRAGISALRHLDLDLADDQRSVCGYVTEGSLENFAVDNFLLVARDRQDVLYENTLPIQWDADIMPSAVVAADLARSSLSREHSAGVLALGLLREQWLARRSR